MDLAHGSRGMSQLRRAAARSARGGAARRPQRVVPALRGPRRGGGGRPAREHARAAPGPAAAAPAPAQPRPSDRRYTRTVTETTRQELWGAETTKAIGNFPVSGEPIPVHVARWLGRMK